MIVFGGLYSIVHLLVIGLKNAKRFFTWSRSISLFTVVLVITGVFSSVSVLTSGATEASPNFRLYSDLFFPCRPIQKAAHSDKKIILRIDDIQAFAWGDVQENMIRDAIERGIPPLLGVIPFGIENDKKIYNYIDRNSCNLEVAQHGWNHNMETAGTVPEFGSMLKEYAKERIARGQPVLERLAGQSVVTFIPPNNAYSEGTAEALKELGFKIISSQGDRQFSYSASTFDSNKNQLVPLGTILSQCQKELDEKNLCIIMTHPQDYATDFLQDEKKYQTFIDLLDALKRLDVEFVRAFDLLADSQINGMTNVRELSDEIIPVDYNLEVDEVYMINLMSSDKPRFLEMLKAYNDLVPPDNRIENKIGWRK